MSRNKFTNIKISVRLYELLKPYPVFNEDGYKAISGAHYLLNKLFVLSTFHEDEWVTMPRSKLNNIFSGYKVSYNQAVTAMEHCGLLEPRKKGYFDRTGGGKSMAAKFKLTELSKKILLDGELEYLRKLADDRFCWKAAAARRKKAKQRYTISGDATCDYVARTLFKTDIDEQLLNSLVKKFGGTKKKKKAQLLNIVTYTDKIRTGSFDSLCRTDVDGRIYHPIVQIKTEARSIFSIDGKTYRGTLDLRGCHPTFFAKYLVKIFVESVKKDTELHQVIQLNKDFEILETVSNFKLDCSSFDLILDFSSLFSTVPPSSKEYLQYLYGFVPHLLEEYKKWNAIWTDPNTDPRDQIATAVGYRHKQLAKRSINSAINGGNNRAVKWITDNFPHLTRIWRCTNPKRIGNNISRIFESEIILNQKVIDAASNINLVLIPEHDGYGIFADPSDSEIENKAKAIEAMIQNNCLEQFGIRPVMKFKRMPVCI